MIVRRHRRVAVVAIGLICSFSLPVFAAQTKGKPQKNASAKALPKAKAPTPSPRPQQGPALPFL
jgi:hypothetical protein